MELLKCPDCGKTLKMQQSATGKYRVACADCGIATAWREKPCSAQNFWREAGNVSMAKRVPCPYCGETPWVFICYDETFFQTYFYVACPNCMDDPATGHHVSGNVGHRKSGQAIREWNWLFGPAHNWLSKPIKLAKKDLEPCLCGGKSVVVERQAETFHGGKHVWYQFHCQDCGLKMPCTEDPLTNKRYTGHLVDKWNGEISVLRRNIERLKDD